MRNTTDDKDSEAAIELLDQSSQPNDREDPLASSSSSAAAATAAPAMSSTAANGVVNNPLFAVLAYCGSSILMTVTNKYVVSGTSWNLSFLLLAVQVRVPLCCSVPVARTAQC